MGDGGAPSGALRVGYILRAPLKAHPRPAIIDRSKIVSGAVRSELRLASIYSTSEDAGRSGINLYFRPAVLRVV